MLLEHFCAKSKSQMVHAPSAVSGMGDAGTDGLVMNEALRDMLGRSARPGVEAAGIWPDVGSGAVIRSAVSSSFLGVTVPSVARALEFLRLLLMPVGVAGRSLSSLGDGTACNRRNTEMIMACMVRSADRRSISVGM